MNRKIPLDEAEAGMILGRPVKDPRGRILMKAGAEVSMPFIEKINKMGIQEIIIDDPNATEDETAVDEDAIRDAQTTKFAGVDDDPVMELLRDTSTTYLINKAHEDV